MKILGSWQSHHFVYDDGTLPTERSDLRGPHVWRALDPAGSLVHLLLNDRGVVDPALAVVLVGDVLSSSSSHLCLPWRPGVSLLDVLAQGQVQGGELPVEVAVFVVAQVARTVARLHDSAHRAPRSGLAQHVRVGFDGGVALWAFDCCPWHTPARDDDDDDDYDNRIGIFPTPDFLRGAPREEPTAPEQIDAAGDLRSDVFLLGGLLWMVLTGAHPFVRADLLSSLDMLRHAELPPLTRDLPAPLVRLMRSALALDPDERPQTADAFARSLSLFVDPAVGRTSTAALARGLFPNTAEINAAFAEEVALVDVAALSRPPPDEITQELLVPDAQLRSRCWLPQAGLGAERRLVSNRDLVEFLIAVGRPAPWGNPCFDEAVADRPATMVSAALAAEVAAFFGGRLPSDEEWSALARGGGFGVPTRHGIGQLCLVWEWTTTAPAGRDGFVVRGGPWRNREERALVDNRSWETEAALDVGFRIVFDAA